MSDRPETQGLPNGAVYYGEKTQEQIDKEKNQSVGSMQWNAVVKNPAVWVLGLASLCVYIARYAVESWGVVYLHQQGLRHDGRCRRYGIHAGCRYLRRTALRLDF